MESPHTAADQSLAHAWAQLGRRTAQRVRTAWLLHYTAPAIAASSLLGCASVLALRHHGITVSLAQTGGIAVLTLGLSLGIATFLAKRHPFTPLDGLVRLDEQLSLHGALSAASAGLRSWPSLPSHTEDGWRISNRWALAPLIGLGLLLTSALIPVTARSPHGGALPPPAVHQRIATTIEKLRDTIAEPDLAQLQEKLDQLTQQPAAQHYQHEHLEAADNLEAKLQQDLLNLAAQLDTSADSLTALTEETTALTPQEAAQLSSELGQALTGIQKSPLGLHPDHKSTLGNLDPSALKSISQDQLRSMIEAMKKASSA